MSQHHCADFEALLENSSPMTASLTVIASMINSTHLLMRYMLDQYQNGGDLEKAMPGLLRHLEMLDRFAGEATTKTASALAEHLNARALKEEAGKNAAN